MATKKTSAAKSATAKPRAKTGASRASARKSAAKPAAKTTPAVVIEKPATPAVADVGALRAEPAVRGVSLTEAKPGSSDDPIKKKELFERVKARAAGVKGRDVRIVLDAVLEELGALLVEGKALNAQPLGILKVQKRREGTGASVVVCRLRRQKQKPAAKDTLAEAAE
jgi:DNA-binding protein HU-alpha